MDQAQPIIVKNFENNNVFLLENVLTSKECKELIEASENKGYRFVSPTGGRQQSWCGIEATEVRINEKTTIDSPEIAARLTNKLRKHLPVDLTFRAQELGLTGDYLDSQLLGAEWRMSSVCDHLRFVKYNKNNQFLKHMDGTYTRFVVSAAGNKTPSDVKIFKEQSFLSIVIYLNDDFKGGETIFYDNISKKEKFSVTPKAGSVLVMLHENLHEGAQVTKGQKYILRSDILYRKQITHNTASNNKEIADAQKKLDKSFKQGVTEIPTEWQKIYHPSCKHYTD